MRWWWMIVLAACELSPVNEDLGTLTKLRVIHIGDVRNARAAVHIVDKTTNPKTVTVQVGVPPAQTGAIGQPPITFTLLEEGEATRLDDALWRYEIDLHPHQAARDPHW